MPSISCQRDYNEEKITVRKKNGVKEREIDYIPVRFMLAILLILLETVAVIGTYCASCRFYDLFLVLQPSAVQEIYQTEAEDCRAGNSYGG